MAWDGDGAFSRTNGDKTGTTVWAQDDAAAINIESGRHDTHDQDMSDGINACLTKNGENSASVVHISGTTAVNLTDNGEGFHIGTLAGAHLAQSPAIIQAKSNATTAAALAINPLGGVVTIASRIATTAEGADVSVASAAALLDIIGAGTNNDAVLGLRGDGGGVRVFYDESAGALKIVQTNAAGTSTEDIWIAAVRNAQVELNHNNAIKFATASDGVTVTGVANYDDGAISRGSFHTLVTSDTLMGADAAQTVLSMSSIPAGTYEIRAYLRFTVNGTGSPLMKISAVGVVATGELSWFSYNAGSLDLQTDASQMNTTSGEGTTDIDFTSGTDRIIEISGTYAKTNSNTVTIEIDNDPSVVSHLQATSFFRLIPLN